MERSGDDVFGVGGPRSTPPVEGALEKAMDEGTANQVANPAPHQGYATSDEAAVVSQPMPPQMGEAMGEETNRQLVSIINKARASRRKVRFLPKAAVRLIEVKLKPTHRNRDDRQRVERYVEAIMGYKPTKNRGPEKEKWDRAVLEYSKKRRIVTTSLMDLSKDSLERLVAEKAKDMDQEGKPFIINIPIQVSFRDEDEAGRGRRRSVYAELMDTTIEVLGDAEAGEERRRAPRRRSDLVEGEEEPEKKKPRLSDGSEEPGVPMDQTEPEMDQEPEVPMEREEPVIQEDVEMLAEDPEAEGDAEMPAEEEAEVVAEGDVEMPAEVQDAEEEDAVMMVDEPEVEEAVEAVNEGPEAEAEAEDAELPAEMQEAEWDDAVMMVDEPEVEEAVEVVDEEPEAEEEHAEMPAEDPDAQVDQEPQAELEEEDDEDAAVVAPAAPAPQAIVGAAGAVGAVGGGVGAAGAVGAVGRGAGAAAQAAQQVERDNIRALLQRIELAVLALDRGTKTLSGYLRIGDHLATLRRLQKNAETYLRQQRTSRLLRNYHHRLEIKFREIEGDAAIEGIFFTRRIATLRPITGPVKKSRRPTAEEALKKMRSMR